MAALCHPPSLSMWLISYEVKRSSFLSVWIVFLLLTLICRCNTWSKAEQKSADVHCQQDVDCILFLTLRKYFVLKRGSNYSSGRAFCLLSSFTIYLFTLHSFDHLPYFLWNSNTWTWLMNWYIYPKSSEHIPPCLAQIQHAALGLEHGNEALK